MVSKFVVHRHTTGRPHFDLRLTHRDSLRSWSLLKEPPCQRGEKRLAIERESFAPEEINGPVFKEAAFGEGKVYTWDEGDVQISDANPSRLLLVFTGEKLLGNYELRLTRWYPGNRWLLKKS